MNWTLGPFRPSFQELLTQMFYLLSSQVGLASFFQRAIHFLCVDQTWACRVWDNFSAASPDVKLSLFAWVVDGRGSLPASLKELIQRVLQVRRD